MTALICASVVSEIFAIFLIWHIWRKDDYKIMKILMTFVALIPILGPLGVLWANGMPPIRNRAYQNQSSSRLPMLPTLEVFDRWRHVLDEKNEAKRQYAAKKLLDEYSDD